MPVIRGADRAAPVEEVPILFGDGTADVGETDTARRYWLISASYRGIAARIAGTSAILKRPPG